MVAPSLSNPGICRNIHIQILQTNLKREFDGFTLFHRHNLLFCFFSSAVERLKTCDDAFRKQVEQERQANEQQIQTLTSEKQQEIDQANARVR